MKVVQKSSLDESKEEWGHIVEGLYSTRLGGIQISKYLPYCLEHDYILPEVGKDIAHIPWHRLTISGRDIPPNRCVV
jgi:hypothetical protein